jgi:hypothetical protein
MPKHQILRERTLFTEARFGDRTAIMEVIHTRKVKRIDRLVCILHPRKDPTPEQFDAYADAWEQHQSQERACPASK